jgi:hypothetical protein
MKSKPSINSLDCERCQTHLPDYVHLELSNQNAEQAYPEIAFHIETCSRCEAVYYREFRTQGQHKTVAELQQVGDRTQVESLIQRILASPLLTPPNTNWRQIALDYGRAWLEAETGRWRQLWLSLAGLGNVPRKTPALAGMMGLDSTPPDVWGTWEISSPDANVEIKLIVVPDATPIDQDRCRVDIALTLKDYFGDFSGVQITLLWDETAYIKETDVWGKVSFTGLPCHQLPSMSLQIVLPG